MVGYILAVGWYITQKQLIRLRGTFFYNSYSFSDI